MSKDRLLLVWRKSLRLVLLEEFGNKLVAPPCDGNVYDWSVAIDRLRDMRSLFIDRRVLSLGVASCYCIDRIFATEKQFRQFIQLMLCIVSMLK